MKNINKKAETHTRTRPLLPKYHSGGAHLHDSNHSGGLDLHDTDHSGGLDLHDTDHSGGLDLHDTDHSGGLDLHDTDHSGGLDLHDTDHSGGLDLHDTDHSGGLDLHDTDHSGGLDLHDTDHSGGLDLHDTDHSGGLDLHDTDHSGSLTGHHIHGKEHGNTHIIKGRVQAEKDNENGKADHHVNYSVNLNSSGRYMRVNDSYFYRGFRNYPQRGYLRFVTDHPDHRDQNHVVFINDKRHQSVRGEQNRRVYFQIRRVPVVIGRNTTEIFVAHNFDVVPHRPVFPVARIWNNESEKYSGYSLKENGSNKEPGFTHSKVTLQQLSHKDFNLNNNSNSFSVGFMNRKSGAEKKTFYKIKLNEEINTNSGFLKIKSKDRVFEDIILFVSERSRIRNNKKIEFELKTVPILIAWNTIEMDVAYFKETFWLFRFSLWIARGLKRLNPL